MKIGVKGQAAAFDIAIIFIAVALFAAGIWTFSVAGKAPSSQAQRSRADYTKSLLIEVLYTTPSTDDPRYHYKSIADILSIYIRTYEADGQKDSLNSMIFKRLKEAKLDEYIRDRSGGQDLDWILYAKIDGGMEMCFHGKGAVIDLCSQEAISADRSSGASAQIVSPEWRGTLLPMDLYLGIVWE